MPLKLSHLTEMPDFQNTKQNTKTQTKAIQKNPNQK